MEIRGQIWTETQRGKGLNHGRASGFGDRMKKKQEKMRRGSE